MYGEIMGCYGYVEDNEWSMVNFEVLENFMNI